MFSFLTSEAKHEDEIPKFDLKDLQFKETVGKGAYGRVRLANIPQKDDTFAVKILKKKTIYSIVHRVKEEILALQSCRSPFIVQLHRVLEDDKKLYLVQSYIDGGEFLQLLKQQKALSESEAVFFAGEILVGLREIHSKGIAFRDLKPENILLDNTGHIVLCDFGLCKQLSKNQKTYSKCGTLDYMSPESLLGDGHDESTDFWSLGVLLLEMVSGKSPFFHFNDQKTAEAIMDVKYTFPDNASKEFKDLISILLEVDVEKRKKSVKGLEKHAWFKTLDWKLLKAKKIDPPVKLKDKKYKVHHKDSLDTIEPSLTSEEKKVFKELAKMCHY